ncbi:hypothetical protein SAMN05421740_10711 [Parapedobacter koreensis]|uniref:Uncharacterized protein n=1 Tax=Parapedobacter koreensis TaxID=332977 RepID=A0A1H7RC37_9SPHI|nr:hypothetical protein SAMN05421740_10711 [Parapedobacter koreensis]
MDGLFLDYYGQSEPLKSILKLEMIALREHMN